MHTWAYDTPGAEYTFFPLSRTHIYIVCALSSSSNLTGNEHVEKSKPLCLLHNVSYINLWFILNLARNSLSPSQSVCLSLLLSVSLPRCLSIQCSKTFRFVVVSRFFFQIFVPTFLFKLLHLFVVSFVLIYISDSPLLQF